MCIYTLNITINGVLLRTRASDSETLEMLLYSLRETLEIGALEKERLNVVYRFYFSNPSISVNSALPPLGRVCTRESLGALGCLT